MHALFFNQYFMQTLPNRFLTSVRSTHWKVIRDFAAEPWSIPFTEAKERVKFNSDTTTSALVPQILSNVKQK